MGEVEIKKPRLYGVLWCSLTTITFMAFSVCLYPNTMLLSYSCCIHNQRLLIRVNKHNHNLANHINLGRPIMQETFYHISWGKNIYPATEGPLSMIFQELPSYYWTETSYICLYTGMSNIPFKRMVWSLQWCQTATVPTKQVWISKKTETQSIDSSLGFSCFTGIPHPPDVIINSLWNLCSGIMFRLILSLWIT